MRIFTIILCILILWLQIKFILGKNGLLRYIQLNTSISEQKLKIFYLEAQNIQLLSKIHDYKNNFEYIEEYARNKFDMIKSDEIFYRIIITNNNSN